MDADRTISFHFTGYQTVVDYLRLFDCLATKHCLIKVRDESNVDQLFTIDDLNDAIATLKLTTTKPETFELERLGTDCVATLTRAVSYRNLVFANEQSFTKFRVRCCDQNDFPVIGIDLWSKGVAALPAGLISITSPDQHLITSIVNQVLEFKDRKS